MIKNTYIVRGEEDMSFLEIHGVTGFKGPGIHEVVLIISGIYKIELIYVLANEERVFSSSGSFMISKTTS